MYIKKVLWMVIMEDKNIFFPKFLDLYTTDILKHECFLSATHSYVVSKINVIAQSQNFPLISYGQKKV